MFPYTNNISNKTYVLLPQSYVTLDDFEYPVRPALWFYFSQNFKIICLSNLLIFSVPNEGHSRSVLCTLIFISTFLFLLL